MQINSMLFLINILVWRCKLYAYKNLIFLLKNKSKNSPHWIVGFSGNNFYLLNKQTDKFAIKEYMAHDI